MEEEEEDEGNTAVAEARMEEGYGEEMNDRDQGEDDEDMDEEPHENGCEYFHTRSR